MAPSVNSERFRLDLQRAAADGEPIGGETLDAEPSTTVILVEGESDRSAVEALADLRGRDFAAEGIVIVPMGGAMSIDRFLRVLAPSAPGLRIAGLVDAAEERFFRRAFERAGLGGGLAELGFFTCDPDLEAELIGALGIPEVERVIEAEGDLASLRTFQNQPAQRGRSADQQLRRFFGTTSGRKIHYGGALVRALDPAAVPTPLDRLLATV